MMQSFQLVWLDLTFACSLCYSQLSPKTSRFQLDIRSSK